jgi:tetratricopeptide (TPR) repeat protein
LARYYQDKFKPAAADLRQALDLRPKSEDTREFLGRSLDRAGEFDAAIVVLNEGIAANPDYLFFYDVQSDVYWDKGDTARSFQMIEQLIAKDGQNADWWKKMIGRHQLAGHQQAAAEYYHQAQQRGILP